MVRIGIIGTNVGAMQAELFKQIPQAKVIWFCGEHLEKTQRIAAELGIPKATNDYLDILNDPSIDLVIIAVPNYLHKEFFLESIKYGKHIVLEKPAGINSKEIQEMLRALKKSQLQKMVIVDHEMRFNPTVRYIKQTIQQGKLGKISNIEITKFHGSSDGQQLYEDWEMLKEQGGGQVLLVGSHIIDLARFLLNFPQFTRGSIHKRLITKDKTTLENVSVQSSSEDFFRSKMLFSEVQVDLYDNIYGEGHKDFELKVTGSNGTFIYDDIFGLFLSNDQGMKKIEIKDPLPQIISKGHSLITNSLKYFCWELVKAIENKTPLTGYCTLEQAQDNLDCFEQCEIV